MAVSDRVGWAREATVFEPTWPSATPARITQLLPVTNVEAKTGINRQFTPATDGAVIGYTSADVVDFVPSIALNMPMRYAGLEAMFVNAMGMEARWLQSVRMPEPLVAGKAYRHLFEFDTHLGTGMPWQQIEDGVFNDDVAPTQCKMRRGTVAVQREFAVWEYLSCMVHQLSFGWAETTEGHCNVDLYAYSVRPQAAINTLESLRKAMPNVAPSVMFYQGQLRIAEYSTTTALSAAHRLQTRTWTCTIQNILQIDQGPRSGLSAEEFERGGTPLVLGSLNLPRYQNNFFIDRWPSNVRLMMDLKFTGPLIPGTSIPYQLNIYIPGLFVIQADPSGPSVSRANLPIQWFAATPSVLPAGFPVGIKQGPLMIEMVNGISAHQLL